MIGSLKGVQIVEMPRNGTKGMCCGAGGGRMWMEEHLGTRINEWLPVFKGDGVGDLLLAGPHEGCCGHDEGGPFPGRRGSPHLETGRRSGQAGWQARRTNDRAHHHVNGSVV